jgi:hypothetical protein
MLQFDPNAACRVPIYSVLDLPCSTGFSIVSVRAAFAPMRATPSQQRRHGRTRHHQQVRSELFKLDVRLRTEAGKRRFHTGYGVGKRANLCSPEFATIGCWHYGRIDSTHARAFSRARSGLLPPGRSYSIQNTVSARSSGYKSHSLDVDRLHAAG